MAHDKESAFPCRRCKRAGFNPWVRKIRWRRAWQPTPVFLPGKFHGQRSLAGYSPWVCKDSDTSEWLNTHCEPSAYWLPQSRQEERLCSPRSNKYQGTQPPAQHSWQSLKESISVVPWIHIMKRRQTRAPHLLHGGLPRGLRRLTPKGAESSVEKEFLLSVRRGLVLSPQVLNIPEEKDAVSQYIWAPEHLLFGSMPFKKIQNNSWLETWPLSQSASIFPL